jgi:hypothetical protein
MRQNPPWVDRILRDQWFDLTEVIDRQRLPVPGEKFTFEELGCGHYGCVMLTKQEGLVFKVTTDASEAAFVAAALTLTEWPPGMIRYHDILELPKKYKKRRVFVLWRQEADNVGIFASTGDERYVKRYGEHSVLEFMKNNRQWQITAAKMRDQMKRASDPAAFLERTRAEADRAWRLYADDRAFKLGPLYANRRMKMIAYGHKGPLAFELRRILLEQLAMEMAHTHAGSLIGEALGYYLEEGMLLADVHLGNIGEAVPEGYEDWDLVITDPGHMVPLDPKWLNVEIQML